MMCLVFSWVHFFVEAGLLLARLDFDIGFEMMITLPFPNGLRRPCCKKSQISLAGCLFHGNLIDRSSEASAGDHPWPERSVRSDSLERDYRGRKKRG
jgi:hypothetical protein